MNHEAEFVSVDAVQPVSVENEVPFIIPQHEIVNYFSEISSKNEAIEGFFKFGSQCFSNLAVFSVFSRSVQFLKGEGENIKENPYISACNVDLNTIIRRVIINKFPYRGKIPVGKDEKNLFSKFFSAYAEEIFLYPGNIRGEETDILFYADGNKHDRKPSLATFEYIVEKTVLSLKLLWVQKQLVTI